MVRMKSLNSDYTGCSVFIYDELGNSLCSTLVTYYNRRILRIEVENPPSGLNAGDACRLLIMTAPKPCEYRGRIIRIGRRKPIAMYSGKELENRAELRYRITLPAVIEDYVCDGSAYPLHEPLSVELINISKGGARLRAPFNSMADGDRFLMRMDISGRNKLLIAEVRNHFDFGMEASEYGCKFLVSSDCRA